MPSGEPEVRDFVAPADGVLTVRSNAGTETELELVEGETVTLEWEAE